jgi:acyl carrier protein
MSSRQDRRNEIVARLAEVVEREIEPGQVLDDHRLQADLGLASLDAVLLTLELEERYDIAIDDEEILSLRAVADLLDLVEVKLAGAGVDGAE